MKFGKLLLLLVLFHLIACDEEEGKDGGPSVTISASGLSDGKLALNNSAYFTAEVSGFDGNSSGLTYRWSLSTGRGGLSDGDNQLPNPTDTGNSIHCIGNDEGDEQINVQVLDVSGNVVGTASYSFTIVFSIDGISRGCYDQPKIIYQRGPSYYVCNFDGSEGHYIGISGGTSAAISPDGEWLAWNDDAPDGWDMWVQKCDGTNKTKIEGGMSQDFIPQFSLDSKTLYFMRPHPNSQPPVINAANPAELASYNLETGEFSYLTSLYQTDERVGYFDVSPVTGVIAFLREKVVYLPEGGYTIVTKLVFLYPETGFMEEFMTLPAYSYDLGMDWSPNGKDIIFSTGIGDTRGIYRLELTPGSQPMLIFTDPSPISVGPLYPHFYDGGDRIVWGGQENGQNSINLWSIDANGNDMQILLDIPQTVFMQGVLH